MKMVDNDKVLSLIQRKFALATNDSVCVHDVLETYHAVTLDPSAVTILFHLS